MSNAPHISLLSPAVGSGNIGDHLIELAVRRLLCDRTVFERFSIRRELNDAQIERINQTSCALVCGTNLFQHDWESALTPRVLDRIHVPVIPFGVGGSAPRVHDTRVSEMTRSMIRAIHRRCALGSVRDPHAQAVVARAGVDNAVLTGCPVLFWAGREEWPAVPNAPARPRRLVLTARNWLMHRWPDNIDHPVQVELLRRVLGRFSGHPFVFAVHEEFDRRLVKLLEIPADAVLDSDDPHQYVALYSNPENAVLAMRLHAGILARANGLPTVFVGHDTRTYSFCQLMGIECIDLFADDAAALCIDRLERAMRGDAPHEPQAAETFARLRHEMNRFLLANGLPQRAAGGRS